VESSSLEYGRYDLPQSSSNIRHDLATIVLGNSGAANHYDEFQLISVI
jgi:hypothetical protein